MLIILLILSLVACKKEEDNKSLVIEAMLKFIVNDDSVDIHNTDLSIYARNYLLNAGMRNEEIDLFIDKITN